MAYFTKSLILLVVKVGYRDIGSSKSAALWTSFDVLHWINNINYLRWSYVRLFNSALTFRRGKTRLESHSHLFAIGRRGSCIRFIYIKDKLLKVDLWCTKYDVGNDRETHLGLYKMKRFGHFRRWRCKPTIKKQREDNCLLLTTFEKNILLRTYWS